MPTIFMCHSSKDKYFVREIAKRLRNNGVYVWIDEAEIQIGDSLIGTIGSAIERIDYVGVVLSKNSIKSEWVQRELHLAMNREFSEKRVVVLPILLEPIELPPFLRDKLYADFTNPENFDREFSKLMMKLGVVDEVIDKIQQDSSHIKSEGKLTFSGSKYILLKSKLNQYYFYLVAGNNEIILNSELYQSKSGAMNGVEAVAEYSSYDACYEKREYKGKYYFVLRDDNDKVIATSRLFQSSQDRDDAIFTFTYRGSTPPIKRKN